ncbi:MAG: hypothetical protein BJ554DRAFT_1708 [Olpidium bornovanus]|uniref:Tetratricopeptide repeat protein n=1 Tax=Olpidium bornovanus TaxID=278681 RepID=A0A8H7ZR64_9FUNG|nr:MAG: hypothetical protein BJ554DRAFT_1708 [Olpidium bornovanus]
MHCFERELWEDSIKAFTSLINAVPEFATAYTFRGRACASLQMWETALEDLTKAIQLAPDRADFFYHRGCLLSERNRKKALEDFGVSLLLDDSPRNARVYFYRGGGVLPSCQKKGKKKTPKKN